jgi:carboxynorspermidine decarboxylase
MDIQELKDKIQVTPAMVWDEQEILNALMVLGNFRERTGCKVLYSIKALPLVSVLSFLKPHVEGFSVSSLFEARLAEEILAGQGSLHLSTPGIKPDEIEELVALCTHISCNSTGQYQRISAAENFDNLGLRVNPKLSFAKDTRFDPCRQFSKLGVDLNEVAALDYLNIIKGLHFHTVYSETDSKPLLQTLNKLQRLMGNKLARLSWLNLGGGYLSDQVYDNPLLIDKMINMKNEFNLDIFIEPGNAIVGNAGYLIATVIDCFNSDGKAIAIMDTSVNHLPQVFEYQIQPELNEHSENGQYTVLLAGNTCLAGDIFGEYRFHQPVSAGDKVVFKGVGAYSLVKANRFNGYNLPDVYLADNVKLSKIKQYSYQDYRQYWRSDDD